jgi:hypothetical protein
VVPRALILSVAGRHYPAIARALSTVGFQVQQVSAELYASAPRGTEVLLVVPEAEGQQLPAPLRSAILADVAGGTPLLLDGPTPLAAALGIKAVPRRATTKQYRWEHYAAEPVVLPGRVAYTRFREAPALKVLAVEPRREDPLVAVGKHGKGQFLFTALPLEPPEGLVFQYLPFLAQAIVDELHIAPTLAADNLCAYIDFGGEPKDNPAAVAAQLRRWSIREVHLGVFYDSDMFREFVPRFIAAAHLEGIAVHAWLEYPMVSEEFWTAHRPWREITASGKPAIMDWRYHMALEDPACFQAVAERTRRWVRDYDWDGVDFAELYFEGEPDIFKHPADFTPMHPAFRRGFKERFGVDPIKMFDSGSPDYGPRNPALRNELKQFRVDLITQLTEQFLEVLEGCRAQKPYLETTLTFIDALRDPTVTERYGVDPERLLALEKRFGFAVEIEDPYTVWNSAPDRYRAIGEYYRPRLRPGTPFSIDINVVDRSPRGRPLNRPRGLELYELLANVAAHVDLITLYAYSTFVPDDMRLVPFVLGAQALADGPISDDAVTARRQLFWQTATRGRAVELDGNDWPCRSDSQVLIPAGTHRVSTRPAAPGTAPDALRIESVNGTLLAAERRGPAIRLTYESRGRCYVTLNRAPATVRCDGTLNVARILTGRDHVCLALPEGKHTVEITPAPGD